MSWYLQGKQCSCGYPILVEESQDHDYHFFCSNKKCHKESYGETAIDCSFAVSNVEFEEPECQGVFDVTCPECDHEFTEEVYY